MISKTKRENKDKIFTGGQEKIMIFPNTKEECGAVKKEARLLELGRGNLLIDK